MSIAMWVKVHERMDKLEERIRLLEKERLEFVPPKPTRDTITVKPKA